MCPELPGCVTVLWVNLPSPVERDPNTGWHVQSSLKENCGGEPFRVLQSLPTQCLRLDSGIRIGSNCKGEKCVLSVFLFYI